MSIPKEYYSNFQEVSKKQDEALKQISAFQNPISRIISETLKIGYKSTEHRLGEARKEVRGYLARMLA